MLATLAATSVAVSGLAVAAPAHAAPPEPGSVAAAPPAQEPLFDDGRYVVLLNELPTAVYDGRITGYPATKPADGERFDATTRAAQRYSDLLERLQDDVLERVGIPEREVTTEYTTVTNGFAAELTGEEAAELSKDPAVLSVSPDVLLQPTTNESPDFLGLTGEAGVWAQLGGREDAGEDTVIGIVDSGIWPESRSFRAFEDQPGRDEVAADLDYTGICDPGEDGSFADACNNKLIGGRYYVETFGADRIADFEYLSPRDAGGHGTHTASTAAGRYTEDVTSEGRTYDYVSGMAPGARLAAYKVCWDGQPGGVSGCFTSDSVSAINDAVADGVDAINFSISGTTFDYTSPVEIAFLNAAVANVFVAASSGNSGPGASSTNHPSPWLTTVAASTHKILESTLELGNGETFIGASVTEGIGQTPAVLAVEAAAEGVDPADAQQCFEDTLDPAVVTGKIVVCDRGVIARVEKSINVAAAGGAGLILVNPTASSVNADNHVIPSIHLDVDARPAIYDYVGGNPDATAAILARVAEGSDTQTPEVIAFSSRGPSRGAGGDIIKPDISAPGVDVLAAVVPDSNYGRDYDLYSGTSMSSPHIAGLSMLLRDQHPDWTPMEIKSAMMTTAYDHATTTDVFAQGSGFVDPPAFFEPGLVYPADVEDWANFLLGQGVDINYPGARAIDASDLNQASIAVGELAGEQTVRRIVRNVGDETLFYRAEVSGLEGIDVSVRPSQLVVSPGQEASFDVTFAYDGAPFGEYAQGHLTWVSGDTEVRSPLAVKPVSVSAPEEVTGEATEGSLTYEVTSGVTGPIDLSVHGLTPGTEEEGSLPPGGLALSPAGNASTAVYRYDVPEGTTLARFDLDAADEGDDFDLFLVNPEFTRLVAQSATGAADERIDVRDPAPGSYYVVVNAFSTTDGQPGEFVLTNYAVQGDEGNMTADPATINAERGEDYDVTLSWSGLEEAPYLGWVGYSGAERPTIVSIEAGSGGNGGGGDEETPAVELSTTRPSEAAFSDWFTYEVRVVNPSDTDLGTADWMLSVEHESRTLDPRDVTVQLLTDEGRERVELARDGEGLSATLAEGVAIPAGADLTFEVRMRARIVGELTFTDRLVGDAVDATTTSTLEVARGQRGGRR
jgi:subtilisin family serine protease